MGRKRYGREFLPMVRLPLGPNLPSSDRKVCIVRLDRGAGKELDLEECSRERLESERITCVLPILSVRPCSTSYPTSDTVRRSFQIPVGRAT